MPAFGKKDKAGGGGIGAMGGTDAQLNDDIKQLEDYERQSKLADAQRTHLKKLQMTELANSKINHMKVINNWRQFMRASKLESLKRDLEVLAQDHEREVDRKDAIINLLVRNLEESDEQIQTAQRRHMQQVDRLSTLHEQRLALLENEFESELRLVRSEFDAELHGIQSAHLRERKELSAIVASVEAEERERDSEVRQEHDTEREDIRTKNVDDINMLRLTLESVIDDLEKQFDEAHAQYMENTEKKTKDFKALTEEDKKFSEEIERQLRQLERLQTLTTYWRKKIGQSEREGRERNRLLKSEREAVMRHYHELKDRMTSSRNGQGRRLTELSLWARDALATNEERLARAERILVLAEQARKLESTSERVLPFVPAALHDELVDAEVTAATEALGAELRAQMAADQNELNANEWTELDRFLRTYNRALLGKLTIEQERARLDQENRDLRSILKQYLDGITVTADAVDGPNPLLVVNGKVNLNQRPVRMAGRADPTVVEGNAVVHAYATQRRF